MCSRKYDIRPHDWRIIRSGYCSITVANHGRTWLIRFVSKNYTHSWNFFTNKVRLVFYVCICLFVKKNQDGNQTRQKSRLKRTSSSTIDQDPEVFPPGPISSTVALIADAIPKRSHLPSPPRSSLSRLLQCTRNVACEHSGIRKPQSIMGGSGHHRLGRELVTRTAVHSGGLVRARLSHKLVAFRFF